MTLDGPPLFPLAKALANFSHSVCGRVDIMPLAQNNNPAISRPRHLDNNLEVGLSTDQDRAGGWRVERGEDRDIKKKKLHTALYTRKKKGKLEVFTSCGALGENEEHCYSTDEVMIRKR